MHNNNNSSVTMQGYNLNNGDTCGDVQAYSNGGNGVGSQQLAYNNDDSGVTPQCYNPNNKNNGGDIQAYNNGGNGVGAQ